MYKPSDVDKRTLDMGYNQMFEDHWFSLSSSSDDEDVDPKPEPDPTDGERMRKAHLLRNMAALNFCHSIKSDYTSPATCYLLQSDLARYEGVTTTSRSNVENSENKHVYLNDCMALLQQQCPGKSFDDWRTIVGAVRPTISEDYEDDGRMGCESSNMECRADELSSAELQLIKSTDNDAKCTHSSVDTAVEGAKGQSNNPVVMPRHLTVGEHRSQLISDSTDHNWLTMDTSEVEIVMVDPPMQKSSAEQPPSSQIHLTDVATEVASSHKIAESMDPTSRSHRPSSSKWHQYVSASNESSSDYSQTQQCINEEQLCAPLPSKRRRQDDDADEKPTSAATSCFKSAREQLILNEHRRNDGGPPSNTTTAIKSLGGRRNLQSKFVPPTLQPAAVAVELTSSLSSGLSADDAVVVDTRLKHIDPKMVELIRSEIMETTGSGSVGWDDIAGLQYAKTTIREAVVWPMLRPDLFTGLKTPPRGILLFGPPGTGKTLIGKCIAAQSKSTFFSISASSLTSKWIGDGEKMVRAMFAVAAVHQPSVIFIDEIDSLLSQRSETEHESSRRLKTEFLVQLDGAATADDERILIVGATNRPQELDEAARRRMVKRLYVPLPDRSARQQILENLLRLERNVMAADEVQAVAEATDGFSGADMKVLCQEASMGPIRSIGVEQMEMIDVSAVRPVNHDDFVAALGRVRSSVSPDDLAQYVRWDETYGSGAMGV